MADLSKTITNSIQCLGPYETTKWGAATAYPMVWGTALWGERAMLTQLEKFITLLFDLASDSSVSKSVGVTKSESIASTMETSLENLQTSNGWYYAFIKPSSNAEDRPTNTYSAVSPSQPVYTSLTVTTTVWS